MTRAARKSVVRRERAGDVGGSFGRDYARAMSRVARRCDHHDGAAGGQACNDGGDLGLRRAAGSDLYLNRTGRLATILRRNGVFCVNTRCCSPGRRRSPGSSPASRGIDHPDRFIHGAPWTRAATGLRS